MGTGVGWGRRNTVRRVSACLLGGWLSAGCCATLGDGGVIHKIGFGAVLQKTDARTTVIHNPLSLLDLSLNTGDNGICVGPGVRTTATPTQRAGGERIGARRLFFVPPLALAVRNGCATTTLGFSLMTIQDWPNADSGRRWQTRMEAMTGAGLILDFASAGRGVNLGCMRSVTVMADAESDRVWTVIYDSRSPMETMFREERLER